VELNLDLSQFRDRTGKLSATVIAAAIAGRQAIAVELLRLSQAEVPLDEGTLQNSGHTAEEPNATLVGYNTPYAAYQHEGVRRDGSHVVVNHQHGRKTKYLEDPMKMNNDIFMGYFREVVSGAINAG
jgi:hypothetical protein